ncbi:hypothetical protein GGR56DRAFT_660890 [Xylariaceae sp. FL0804]|nr:hypothetical protein GGR56DRAFT_660890 [Xylariaceae sp. FL0804]
MQFTKFFAIVATMAAAATATAVPVSLLPRALGARANCVVSVPSFLYLGKPRPRRLRFCCCPLSRAVLRVSES